LRGAEVNPLAEVARSTVARARLENFMVGIEDLVLEMLRE
jgi:hypothetical protein